jgi:hypothetical protein
MQDMPAKPTKTKKPAPELVLNGTHYAKPLAKRKPDVFYTEAIADEICERLINGESLETILNRDDMPSRMAMLRWRDKYPEFAVRYTRAREDGADRICEKALADVNAPITPEMAQVARLRFDAAKWYASKVAPRTWGDKVEIESRSVNVNLEAYTDKDRVRAFAGLLARVKCDPESGGDGSPI